MLIGLLQCGYLDRGDVPFRDYDELYPEMLAGHGFDFRTWRVVDMEFPDSVHDADGWLIGGSRHGAYEALPFISPLEEFVREARSGKVPLVGICFGHQIIAQALGGSVQKFPGGWAVGRHDYAFDGETMTLNAWHQDQVIAAPDDAVVVGTSPFCRNAALAYGEAPIFSVQAHPEFGRETVSALLEHRAPGLVPDDLIDTARQGLGLPDDNARMAERIAAFFKERADG